MDIESARNGKPGIFAHGWGWIKSLAENFASKMSKMAEGVVKLGKDDPRRVAHSLKVGLALSFVSVIYYCQPIYDSFGVSTMWAIMTVVVVFEYSVGATLSKGLNRGLATLLAGALGIGAHHLACLSGKTGEPILLGFFVFLQAATSTFVRFFPKIKARYDYGMLIFILTFSLVTVSGFRDDEILEMAHRRLSTVLIGGAACVLISVLICPVWAGQDLHNLIALNIEKLANFLEGFGDVYFQSSQVSEVEKSSLQGYKSVLGSKSSEEALANFAGWEPGHGRFHFRHPWKNYLKIGTTTRQCAYRIEALDSYLKTTAQAAPEIPGLVQDACKDLSLEASRALMNLASCIKTMTHPTSADSDIENCQTMIKNLKSLLKTSLWKDADLLAIIPAATVASLLIDVLECTEKITESVHELSSLAGFESIEPTVSPEKSKNGPNPKSQNGHSGRKVANIDECPQVVINVEEASNTTLPEKNVNPPAAPVTMDSSQVPCKY